MVIKDAKRLAADAMKENERLQAENYRLEGLLEYVAMMADVDLPDTDGEGEDDE